MTKTRLPLHWLFGGALLGAAGCVEGSSCVARGTRVTVPGGVRRIEELGLGDPVVSVDPATGRVESSPISAIRTAERETCDLQLADGTTLAVTTDHPIWCPVDERWAPAGDWARGLRRALARWDGETLSRIDVAHVHAVGAIRAVFDLTVTSPLHDFLANGVLVHNKLEWQPDAEGARGRDAGMSAPLDASMDGDVVTDAGRADASLFDAGDDAAMDASFDGAIDGDAAMDASFDGAIDGDASAMGDGGAGDADTRDGSAPDGAPDASPRDGGGLDAT